MDTKRKQKLIEHILKLIWIQHPTNCCCAGGDFVCDLPLQKFADGTEMNDLDWDQIVQILSEDYGVSALNETSGRLKCQVARVDGLKDIEKIRKLGVRIETKNFKPARQCSLNRLHF